MRTQRSSHPNPPFFFFLSFFLFLPSPCALSTPTAVGKTSLPTKKLWPGSQPKVEPTIPIQSAASLNSSLSLSLSLSPATPRPYLTFKLIMPYAARSGLSTQRGKESRFFFRARPWHHYCILLLLLLFFLFFELGMVEKKVERDSSGPGWHRTEVTACQWIIEAAIRGSEAEGGMVVIFFFFGCLGRFFVERVERSFFFFFQFLAFFSGDLSLRCPEEGIGKRAGDAPTPETPRA